MIVSRHNIEKILPQFKNISDDDFIVACNSVGMEVEQVFNHQKPTGLIIGEIINVEKHPNSDKLHVCTVNVGHKEPYIIVCGASNIKNRHMCVVALQETKLFDGKIILNREVKSVLSQGMMCGYSEIVQEHPFLSKDDFDGIILLKNAKIGDTNIGPYIGLDNTEYEITLPSDRNDLNGLLAFCQEIAKYFNFDYRIEEEISIKGENLQNNFINENVCTFFSTTEINNITVDVSDWNVKKTLISAGISSVNSIVDELALITMETNIPSALYDADSLPNKNLVVKKLEKQTDFFAMDGKKYILQPGDIVVMSNDEIVSLAGIIGSEKHKIKKNTQKIVVEFGNFYYDSIRSTTIRLNCFTDSGKRFSKKISNWFIEKSIQELQTKYAGVTTKFSKLDAQTTRKISIEKNLIKDFLDLEISFEEIVSLLVNAKFVVTGNDVIVPIYRIDLQNQQDIFEEILKIIDFNKLESKPIVADFLINRKNQEHTDLNKIKDIMNNNYFQETKSYNLTSEKDVNRMNIFKINPIYKIENSNNENRSILRTNLIDSLLKVYEFNSSYKTQLQPIFEIQKIYSNQIFNNLAAVVEERKVLDKINGSQIEFNVPGLRALLGEISDELNTSFDFFPVNENQYFYEDESFTIQCRGQVVGYLGLIKKKNLKMYGLENKKIYCLSINLNVCMEKSETNNFQVKTFSNIMPISRDLSFSLIREGTIVDIQKELNSLEYVQEWKFIDRFVDGNKSTTYTIRIIFKSDEKNKSDVIEKHLGNIAQKINSYNVK